MRHLQKNKIGSKQTKVEIVAEYLTGAYSYRKLADKVSELNNE